MASNNISKYYKVDGGLDLTSDSQFATLSANEKIVYKPSGEKYIKNSNYSNVFDKTDTFGDLERSLKAQAVRRIENSGNPDGTTNYYSIDGTKLGSFISGVSPKDLSDGLGNVRSTSISVIDDANGNGVCSCKNTNGTQIDTFTCHVPVSNNNSSLNWGQQSIIGYVDGKVLTINMPGNPDTKYYAGTGLGLSGTTFYIDENWLRTFIGNNSSSPEIQEAIYSSVSVFGTSSSDQDSYVGQTYAGSQLYKTVSGGGTTSDRNRTMSLSNSLTGTWRCITASSVWCTKSSDQTTTTTYTFHVKRGTFIKV